MSTEYRTGVPSRAHIAAAERLGLLWRAQHNADYYWRFDTAGRSVYDDRLHLAQSARLSPIDDDERIYYYRPIRPDGTPVDWETLDAEVARVAAPAQLREPQGFRADLWRRICEHSLSEDHTTVSLADIDRVEDGDFFWKDRSRRPWRLRSTHSADILTRWTVYQELKPLYDIVDGVMGEAAMPRDVLEEYGRQVNAPNMSPHTWVLGRDSASLFGRYDNTSVGIWRPNEGYYGAPLRNFAAVLDAVAEARVQERQATAAEPTPSVSPLREQCGACAEAEHTGATTNPYTCGADNGVIVTYGAVQAETVIDDAALRELVFSLPNILGMSDRVERGSRQRDRYIVRVTLRDPNIPLERSLAARIPRNVHIHCQGRGAGGQRGVSGTAAIIYSPTGRREDAIVPAATPETPTSPEPRRFADVRPDRHGWRWWLVRHALPLHQTWLRIDHNRPYDWSTVETVIPTDEQGNPVSWGSIGPADQGRTDPVRAIVGSPPTSAELPRFTADELDDVDHSRTTKLDQATLRRGKLPTVEQIAKYREVRAKRLGDSTIASALKESRIDCEVAQHVLERWASGLGHTEVQDLCKETQHLSTRSAVDKKVESILNRFTFDTAELSDAASLRKRQEADERKQRLAQVQAQIATERAQRQHHSNEEPNFFNLIEID